MITIINIHIKNFRSIVDETIDLRDFNCFVGKNDSGKSNVLKALNLFFNNKTDVDTELDFDTDYSIFAKRGQKQAKEIVIELEINIPDTFKENGIKKWTKTWRTHGLHSDNTSSLFKSSSKGFTYLNRIRYLYIPAVKSNAYFKMLLSDVYASMTNTANSALREVNDKYSIQLQSLTIELKKQLKDVLNIESAISMPSNLENLFRDLNFSTSDDDVKNISLDHRGDGIKARHIPSILRFIQRSTEKNRLKGSISGTYIWGFEEPENGVEYLSCFEMSKEFFSYIEDCQIMITTHSPAFYMQCKNEKAFCYYTRKENGHSKYLLNDDNTEIGEEMGLMQIVAPFILAVKNEYIKEGYSANHNLIMCIREVMEIMKRASDKIDSNQILNILDQYTFALDLLDDYDHDRLVKPEGNDTIYTLEYEECKKIISQMAFGKDSSLFGNEKDDSFKGCIGNIYQSFGGVDIYPSAEEKAANLLYFITKDHSFSDGNKRIAAQMFLYFLEKNKLLFQSNKKTFSDSTLVAITILIAESKPEEKETMIKLIMNLLDSRL